MESVKVMKRRRVSVACLEETKWKGDKAKELADGYKLFYTGKNNTRNGVGIVVDKYLKEKIVVVKRLSDRIITIKLVLSVSNSASQNIAVISVCIGQYIQDIGRIGQN